MLHKGYDRTKRSKNFQQCALPCASVHYINVVLLCSTNLKLVYLLFEVVRLYFAGIVTTFQLDTICR